jgi:DNA polymerase-3 subunit delta'
MTLRTRGQAAAVDAARSILDGAAHALLLTGPAGVGKTTLALDLAAIRLCTGAAGDDRPCGTCRGCRLVAGGNHPDVHRLAPDGPGGQIRIGERLSPDPGTVRRLIADLALLPVEGGARVAIVEGAHRLNEDAQSALLKTLEEPPAGVLLILCADDEERLLPTIRSRCARVRLGTLGARDIEALLESSAVADAPAAARLARVAGGRPGMALAYAGAPEAVRARSEIARSLLDLIDAPRARRLAAAKELLAASTTVAAALTDRVPQPEKPADPEPADDAPEISRRGPAAERRRGALQLVATWRDVARDLAVVQLNRPALVRDVSLLDELGTAARGLEAGAAAAFLGRLERAGELLESNVGPELVVDGLLVAWPRRR